MHPSSERSRCVVCCCKSEVRWTQEPTLPSKGRFYRSNRPRMRRLRTTLRRRWRGAEEVRRYAFIRSRCQVTGNGRMRLPDDVVLLVMHFALSEFELVPLYKYAHRVQSLQLISRRLQTLLIQSVLGTAHARVQMKIFGEAVLDVKLDTQLCMSGTDAHQSRLPVGDRGGHTTMPHVQPLTHAIGLIVVRIDDGEAPRVQIRRVGDIRKPSTATVVARVDSGGYTNAVIHVTWPLLPGRTQNVELVGKTACFNNTTPWSDVFAMSVIVHHP